MTDENNNGAATEAKLGELHGVVAEVLTSALAHSGEEGPSAALLGAAITFLKNNNITASPTKNKELAELNATLNARRRRKAMTPEALAEAAASFEAMNGMNGMVQ